MDYEKFWGFLKAEIEEEIKYLNTIILAPNENRSELIAKRKGIEGVLKTMQNIERND